MNQKQQNFSIAKHGPAHKPQSKSNSSVQTEMTLKRSETRVLYLYDMISRRSGTNIRRGINRHFEHEPKPIDATTTNPGMIALTPQG